MKRLVFRTLLLLLCGTLVVSGAAQAARVDGLFQAEVDVAGRDGASRNAGLRKALAQVLVRVTGSAGELDSPQARQILAQSDRYTEQFRFHQVPASGEGGQQLRLWVQFDGVTLSRDVRDAGLPFWGADRPDVLVWMAIDDGSRRYLLAESGGSVAGELLQGQASRRGIPLMLPLMDLEDRSQVSFADVQGGFSATLDDAAGRYRPAAQLIAALGPSASGTGWRGRWTLVDGSGGQNWDSHGASLGDALSRGFSEAADRLAMQYAYVASSGASRQLTVEGIHGLADYAGVYRYLESLTPVAAIDVLRVSADQVEFQLDLNSDDRQLLQVITLGNRLRPIDTTADWRFTYQP